MKKKDYALFNHFRVHIFLILKLSVKNQFYQNYIYFMPGSMHRFIFSAVTISQ